MILTGSTRLCRGRHRLRPCREGAGDGVLLRLLGGLAACGGVVLARTIVRDLAEKGPAAQAVSLIQAFLSSPRCWRR